MKKQESANEDNIKKSDADKLKLDRRANDFLERSSEFLISEIMFTSAAISRFH